MRLDKRYRAWLIEVYAKAKAQERFSADKLDDENRKFDYLWGAAQASILQQSVYQALGYTEEAGALVAEMEGAVAGALHDIEVEFDRREKAKGNA